MPLREETGKSTSRIAGVGVLASRERLAEITSGKSCGHVKGDTLGKDQPYIKKMAGDYRTGA
jgi:hypothetical protein